MTEQVALQRIATQLGEESLLLAGLHALGDDAQVQRLAQGDDGRDDGACCEHAATVARRGRRVLKSCLNPA